MSKKLCAALAVLFLLLGCALPVFAAPDLPQDKTTLQAKLAYSGQPLAGVEVTLHRVADISETSPWITFTLCGDFANYPVDLLELTDKEWADAASTLANYALADSLAPIATATTDQNGLVDFANLDSGLYLLQAAQTTDQAGWRYFPAPSLLVLPAYDTAQGQWNTQAQAVLKVERKAPLVDLEVSKVWSGNSLPRPESVTVELICNGVLKETVTLSEANHWKHTFTGLEGDKTYALAERDVPNGYTVTIAPNGERWVITNTCPDKDTSDPGGDPGQTPGTDPGQTVGTAIPQTGLLWWPVPVMAVGGVALFGAGWKLRDEDGEQP